MKDVSVLYVGQYYDLENEKELLQVNKIGVSSAGNTVQYDLLSGMSHILGKTKITHVTTLPAAMYPKNCTRLLFKNNYTKYPNGSIGKSIGFINLPFIKEIIRTVRFYFKITNWLKKNKEENKVIFVFDLYTPILRAISWAKRSSVIFKTCIMVSDLPGVLGADTGRRGILKLAEQFDNKNKWRYLLSFDCYVFMSEPMEAIINKGAKPYCIVEGVVDENRLSVSTVNSNDSSIIFFYGGSLNRQFGIDNLLKAFKHLPGDGYRLWLCGKGDMEDEIKAVTQSDSRITYFGYVSKEIANQKMMESDILVNPRTPEGDFTNYSFPSKNMEYLLAGKPVVCYKLGGIPDEYDNYFQYVKGEGWEALLEKLLFISNMPKEERDKIGTEGKRFVVLNKNKMIQAEKIVSLFKKILA